MQCKRGSKKEVRLEKPPRRRWDRPNFKRPLSGFNVLGGVELNLKIFLLKSRMPEAWFSFE
jgi:hypothetical protein